MFLFLFSVVQTVQYIAQKSKREKMLRLEFGPTYQANTQKKPLKYRYVNSIECFQSVPKLHRNFPH